MTDSCATCIFYVGGSCREHAPGNVAVTHGTGGQVVPCSIPPEYWCGDGISTVDGYAFSPKTAAIAVPPKWLTGAGVPGAGLGNNGDWYLQVISTTSLAIFTKAAGAWVFQTSSAS
jgi:hypothetical protein